jgi:hypothetical protein
MNVLENKLINLLYECQQHKKRIHLAYQKMQAHLPLTVENYAHFDDDEIEHIDQFLFRFAKLQDTLGEKVFPTLLLLLSETISNKPFIDILHKLEKLELLNKADWLALRQIRNNVAHEYAFNTSEIVESLNAIYAAHHLLIAIYDGFYQYCLARFDFLSKSDLQ